MNRKTRKLHLFTFFLTGLLVLAVLPIYSLKVWGKIGYTDFLVYYRAASRFKAGDLAHVYNFADGTSPYRYAPPTLLLFRPLAELGLQQAQLAWFYLQFLFFGLGFYFIYKALRQVTEQTQALWITCTALLFVLRFCLDCFMIGQSTSLLFLGFSIALWAWISGRPILAGLGLFVPAFFKIGPAFTYLLFTRFRGPQKLKALAVPFVSLAAACVISTLAFGSWQKTEQLWSGWVQIVQGDSRYYDASHYGSQSIKSALLRLANLGWVTPPHVSLLYLTLVTLGCLFIAGVWLARTPTTPRSRGYFFSLGIFAYMWFMPETFKYSLTPLAIPVALLLSAPALSGLSVSALVLGLLTLSTPGKDVVGDTIFFTNQKISVPLVTTFVLAYAILSQLWSESVPSRLSRWVRAPFGETLGPWTTTPQRVGTLSASLLIAVPLKGPSNLESALLEKGLENVLLENILNDASDFLTRQTGASFEILLIPYGDRMSDHHPLIKKTRELIQQPRFENRVRLLGAPEVDGRGSALRTAFLSSRGEWILVAHMEQPCDFSFFKQALELASANPKCQLVRANRRLSQSQFKIPVSLLPKVYSRHRMGVLFNRLVRLVLPIRTTDTHSNTYLLKREMAILAFALQTSADFLFDLELSLIALTHGYEELELPVLLNLTQEKSFNQVYQQSLNILYGLPKLAWRFHRGYYHRFEKQIRQITADDWGLTPGINQGILELARLGIVRRVSIMANTVYAKSGLTELSSVPGIELGLHFNLTYGKTSARLAQWIGVNEGPRAFLVKWMTPSKNHKELVEAVREELRSQLKTLKDAGIQPDYFDGHHHIHLVPGLIKAVADILQEAGIKHVRLPYDPGLWLTPKAPLLILSLMARSRLRRHGFDYSACVYPQTSHFNDHGRLRATLTRNPGAEVIVHPARSNDIEAYEYPDSYTSERVREFLALRMLLA